MVGHPKHLHDLDKIEATVSVKCRQCGHERVWSVEDLASQVRLLGGSLVWSEVTRKLRCSRAGCLSTDLRALPIPYGRRRLPPGVTVNKPKALQQMVRLALTVLDRSATGSNKERRDTLEVRLALTVLWCILTERRHLREYWHKANNVSGVPWEGCRDAYYGIAKSLRDEGWHAPV